MPRPCWSMMLQNTKHWHAQTCLTECVFGLFVFLRYSLNFVVPATNIDSLAIWTWRENQQTWPPWPPWLEAFTPTFCRRHSHCGGESWIWGCKGFWKRFSALPIGLVWGNRCKFCRRGGDTLFLECDQCCNLQTKTGLFSLKKFCDSENPKSSIMHGFVENYLFQMRGNQYWRYIHFISIFHFQYCTQNMRFWEDCNQNVKFPLKFWKYPSSDSTTPKDPGMS